VLVSSNLMPEVHRTLNSVFYTPTSVTFTESQ